ncbi:hypothetical protein ACFQ05_11845 [Amycolatopsis umgeniensis]|uniref:Uncharacterized protein n=1 Tax=Amycolatopsis umgeniensis TaxID=336628 RepID=A0A841B5Z1_9PSEU|nr:hypothetical protein [Amycolatopsis umgeniensis]MBB5853992.1 hypothetical protein [Amycolatopsis umgeniensis]
MAGALEYRGPLSVDGVDVATMGQLPAAEAQATDTTLYGDQISTLRRADAIWGETLSPGYLTVWATIASRTLAASVAKFCVYAVHTGLTGFDFGVYVGPDASSLSRKVTVSGLSWIATAGMRPVNLGALAVNRGDAVAFAGLTTGSGTAPRLASTTPTTGAGASALLNETPYSVYRSGQVAPLPLTLNLNDAVWTRANQKFWGSLR